MKYYKDELKLSLVVTGNAIENMGNASPRPVEGTLLPPPRPSPDIDQDELDVHLYKDLNSVGTVTDNNTKHITQ